jgi:c(7)-type cytochrome triheme protein
MVRVVVATALVAASLVAASIAHAAGPPVIGTANRRFDHDRHASSAGAAGKTVPCAGCHDDKQKAEHGRCASCHVFPSSCSVMQTPGVAAPARVCRTCHTPTRPECLPRDMPPLPAAGSFSAKFTHAKHLATGPSIERDCALCHRAQAAAPPAQKPHVLCSGCHNPNGVKPSMAECTSCHGARAKPAPPAGDPYRLSTFDHRSHANASKLTSCLQCHDKPVGDLPKPSMLGCQTRCHDGKKAFSATGTRCTACHKTPVQAQVPAARRELGFSHAEHRKHNVKIDDCAACHTTDADGVLAAPGTRKDHLPCANQNCHQSDYVARAPKICGVCHDAAVPWARAVSRPGKPVAVEWFQAMNHASHLAGKPATCESCHGDKRTGAPRPRDHRACSICHARQAPVMTDCAACHTGTRASPPPSAWSVAAAFDHTTHAVDPRTRKPTACTECHKQIASAKDMASVAPPRMADCDGCHDGKSAFKSTGFGCARCHGPKLAAATAASSPRAEAR